ncbi:MAG: oligopeptide/dipeptide ABC transporter ATP-binding protein [Thermoplasmatota archaeon]
MAARKKKKKEIKLWAKDLKKYFQTQKNPIMKLLKGDIFVKAVDDINFEVKQGEVFGIVGESGSGKTTVGENVLMLQEPTEGQLYYEISKKTKREILKAEENNDQELLNKLNKKYSLRYRENLREMRNDIQMIFQDPSASLNPSMTVYQAIAHPVKIHNMADNKKEEKKKIVHDIMNEVGLSPPSRFDNVFPRDLSGGQKQRVVIARAMVLNPSFIVADEPVAMLDMSIRSKILRLLMNLKEELDLTFLLITHDLATAKFVCDRIAIMYLGKIVEVGDAKEIFQNPKHPYTKLLLETIPRADPRKKSVRKSIPTGEIPDPINVPHGCRFHPRCLESTPRCGWSPKDLKNYININLLDILSEQEIEKTDLQMEVNEEENSLLIPYHQKVWNYVEEKIKEREENWVKTIKEWDTGDFEISKNLKEQIFGNENKDNVMKVVFKDVEEPDLKEVEGVKVACVLYE